MSASRRRKKQEQPDLVVPLIEEEARVEKRQVSKGRLRIRTVADVVEELASATLEEENVDVVRVPVNRVVTKVPRVRTRDGVTIIPSSKKF